MRGLLRIVMMAMPSLRRTMMGTLPLSMAPRPDAAAAARRNENPHDSIDQHLPTFTVIYRYLQAFTGIYRHSPSFTGNLDTFGVAIQEVLTRKLSPKWRCNNPVVFTGQTGLLASPGAAGSGRRRPTPPFTLVIAHRSTCTEPFLKTFEKG